MSSRRPLPWFLRVTVGMTGVLALGACSSAAEERSPSAESSGPRVIQPGAPGEEAKEVEDPGQVVPEDTWNHSDVAFMQMMIPHHGQALEMSRLARKRAVTPQVRTLAERIHGSQLPEIRVMASWLEERDVEVPGAADDPGTFDHSQHGHSEMAGMLTETEMRELRRSRGKVFDRLFLTGMIGHHEGAIAMAEDVARDGADVRVAEIAADVAAGQSAEIARMEDMLEALGSRR